jgi:four helix bundle protein
MFNFEKLQVWNDAVKFADLVYRVTRSYPNDERFGLTDQIQRAAVSVSSNIAEGSSRLSRADFARFIEISMGSVFEVVSQSYVSRNHGFLSEAFQPIYCAAEKQGKLLSGLRRSLTEV